MGTLEMLYKNKIVEFYLVKNFKAIIEILIIVWRGIYYYFMN